MRDGRWTPGKQGDAGELSAALWLAQHGADVFVPFGRSSDVDLVANFDDRVLRVQVKTSTFLREDRWEVRICTRGGNQSWSGVAKYFDAARVDYLFVHVGDGRRWFIPSSAIAATACLRIGGPKYAEYEIEPAQPLQSRSLSAEYTA